MQLNAVQTCTFAYMHSQLSDGLKLVGRSSILISEAQEVTKRCRLSLPTNSALRVQMRGEGGSRGAQPMKTAVYCASRDVEPK